MGLAPGAGKNRQIKISGDPQGFQKQFIGGLKRIQDHPHKGKETKQHYQYRDNADYELAKTNESSVHFPLYVIIFST